jgi:hypothetical protein
MESITRSHLRSPQDSDGPSPPSGRTCNQKALINKLNYINFIDGTISAIFRHNKYATTLSLKVKPLPCSDDQLTCLWVDTDNLQQHLRSHEFLHLLIPDGQKTLVVEPEKVEITEQLLEVLLPKACSEINLRKTRRHLACNIAVQMIQNGTSFQGTLINFSAVSLHVKVISEPPKTFQWINPTAPVNIVLSNQQGIVYSGEFEISNQSCGQRERSFILMLVDHQIRKFKPKKYRSTRQCLVPSPNIYFPHPLTGRSADLKIQDISGSGFSVEEDRYNSLLLPGLIIPDMQISFPDGFRLCCRAQVIYRRELDSSDKENRVKCGLAILDMKIEDQARLLGVLNQVQNEFSYVSNQINLDDLWKFFFETGFIYPKKYASIQPQKEILKDTYQKVYKNRSTIARHFIYQDNGKILAHMAMIRFYRKAWMIHHHASQREINKKGGIMVLKQISGFINELHRLYSAHMDFIFCYFRPNNRFPRRIFGGTAEYINNPKGCSVDTFAYFQFQNSFNLSWEVKGTWSLGRSCDEDLRELNRFLEYQSGGLIVPAFDLEPDTENDEELREEFKTLGLKRERHLFSMKINGLLKAVIIANISDMGLNMSNLTNCLKIFILDPVGITKDILNLMLSMLCVKLKQDQIPVLIYPSTFAKTKNFPIEKEYNLFILNLQYLDQYFEFANKTIPGF